MQQGGLRTVLLPDGLPRFGIPLAELRERVAQRSPQPLVDHLSQGSSNEEGLQHVAAFLSCSDNVRQGPAS